MIRCVVFDFDGTLVDSNEIKRRAFFEVLRPFDPSGSCVERALAAPDPGDRFDVMRAVAAALAEVDRLPPERSPEAWAQAWARAYGRACEEAIAAAREIPGAGETLRWLAERGATLFVSSATPREALAQVVARRGLAGLFAEVHGRPAGKPEHLSAIAQRTGAAPHEIVMVGDGEDDRQAAQGFGCAFVGVDREGGRRFAVPPRHRIADLHALRPLLEQLGGIAGPHPGEGGTLVAARCH
jgi:phosphoglycolate phosphatase-like HAD superfamily hydrolase